jgi:hypothetical protein
MSDQKGDSTESKEDKLMKIQIRRFAKHLLTYPFQKPNQ